MRVRRGNVSFDLKDKNQIDAFRNSEGWTFDDEGINDDTPSEKPLMDPPVPPIEEPKYSRSEIMRMSTADLKETATSIGIEVTEESTGKALKEEILAKLGL